MTEDNGEDKSGLLYLIERIGNRLPDPNTLFVLGTVLVMAASLVAASSGWEVQERLPRQVVADDGSSSVEWVATENVYTAKSLVGRDGIFWFLKNLVKNFVGFPPLGVVLVGMLGIGVAERFRL